MHSSTQYDFLFVNQVEQVSENLLSAAHLSRVCNLLPARPFPALTSGCLYCSLIASWRWRVWDCITHTCFFPILGPSFLWFLSPQRGCVPYLAILSEVAQLCPTLCDPVDYSLPGSSIHVIFQARVLEWVAISFSRGSSLPRDRTWVSHIAGRRFTVWATREAKASSKQFFPDPGVQSWRLGVWTALWRGTRYQHYLWPHLVLIYSLEPFFSIQS